MFQIKLVDINGDGLVVDCETVLETLAEVELLVERMIDQHLHINCTVLEYIEDLTYSVWANGRDIGLVVVKSVNEPSQKRK